MTTHVPIHIRLIRGLFRGLFRLVAVLLVAMLCISSGLQIPAIQTYIVQKLAVETSSALGFPVSIGHVDINWFDTVELDDIVIKDQSNSDLIVAKHIVADFQLHSLIQRNIRLDQVTLSNGKVNIFTDSITQKININEFVKAIVRLTDDSTVGPSASPPTFSIDDIKLDHVKLNISDFSEDSIRDSFDYYYIRFDSLQADVTSFRVRSDTIEFNMDYLKGIETGSDIKIHYLTTFFRYTEYNMMLWDLKAQLNNTFVRDTLELYYKDTRDFSDFNKLVTMRAHLDSSSVSAADVALFAPSLDSINETVVLSGNFKGTVADFDVRNMTASFGKNSYVAGAFGMEGLPNFDETYIAAKIKESSVDTRDFQQYISDEEAFATVKKFGSVNINGRFNGFPYDFVANGILESDIGKVESDIHLTLAEKPALSTYEGNLKTEQLNIGLLSKSPDILQLIDMKGHIKGKGFTLATVSADVDATIDRIGVNGYDYKNIITNATLGKKLFSGKLEIKDPNLVFKTEGTVDFRKSDNIFNIKANIAKANLKPLNLSDKEANFSTDLDINFRGIQTNNFTGNATFRDSRMAYDGRNIALDSLRVATKKEGAIRSFWLNSDWLTTAVKGNFEFEELAKDLPQLASEYAVIIRNNQAEMGKYYAKLKKQKHLKKRDYELDFKFALKNINPILVLSGLESQLYVSKKTNVEGTFSNGTNSNVTFNVKPDTLVLNGQTLFKSVIDFSASKSSDTSDVIAEIYLSSQKQQFKGLPASYDMVVDASWDNQYINFSGRVKQQNSSNYAKIAADIFFRKGQTEAKIRPSVVSLLGEDWNISPNNSLILLENNKILVRNLQISNKEQLLRAEGVMATQASDSLHVFVQNFDLLTIDTLLHLGMSGLVNADIRVSSVLTEPSAGGVLNVQKLAIDNFLIGNVNGFTAWDDEKQKLKVNLDINRLQANVLKVIGHYDPFNKDRQLDLNVHVNGLSVKLIEPFIGDYLSDWGGTATGILAVYGKTSNPIVEGDLAVENGHFKVNIINTTYTFADKISFSEGKISFTDTKVVDENGHVGRIEQGVLWHTGFSDFGIDFIGSLNNFQVMNLKSERRALYYGNANVSGQLYMKGAFSNLNISADVKSEKGTRIFIPVASYYEGDESIEQDFIQFINKESEANSNIEDTIPSVSLSGLKLDFNMELTPDAYCELIFDQKAGDIVRANGEGKIKLGLDTRGDFTMFGQYNITKGSYNFTLKNLVNKAFTITPGSNISWNGSPLGGRMNINATYNLNASLRPLISDPTNLNKPEAQRAYPTSVSMRLEGGLLTPQIGLGLKILDYPSVLGTDVTSFEAKLQNNEQELNRQVFSLLLLRNFLAIDGNAGVALGAGGSISELLSNQLSAWASEVNPNLQVAVDANGLDRDALNAVRARVSYNFMEGRLRITRDGTFTNSQSATTASSVAGDWTLEYMLTRNGRFRIKAFHKSSQNVIVTQQQNTTSQGVSIMHTQSFDSFRDLFPSRKKKREKALREAIKPDDTINPETPDSLPKEALP